MRYQVLATDYDGTLADQGTVSAAVLDKLQQLKASGRKLVLVTGREMKDLVIVFPSYAVFDYIVAENGALIHEPGTGQERLLGPSPDPSFVRALQDRGVHPISVGKVIVATWVPHEQAVLDVIKASGLERQVIFNKGAVMILPPGINKATGLQSLLESLHLSLHNAVGIGDAENDTALLQACECAAAVCNALPALKTIADCVTEAGHGDGVSELMDRLLKNDLEDLDIRLRRHFLELGKTADKGPFAISPYRSGIMVSGITGGGKTTFTLSIIEVLVQHRYQFCLIDPEGDYADLPGALVLGNESSLPSMEEIGNLLKDPLQNLVICTLSIPLADRPAFFDRILQVIITLRREYGHPHWLLMDEAHHLVPAEATMPGKEFPSDLGNFILISTSPHALGSQTLSRVGMVMTVGKDAGYPIDQFCKVLGLPMPEGVPELKDGEICIWDRESGEAPFAVQFNLPTQLMQRHKKKYAQGDMGDNSFVFTGRENKLKLRANNLMMYVHLAEGIDNDTWSYHLRRKDYLRWFRDTVHDDELAAVAEQAEKVEDAAASKKAIIDAINKKYTG